MLTLSRRLPASPRSHSSRVRVGADPSPSSFAWEHRTVSELEPELDAAIATAKGSGWKSLDALNGVSRARALLVGSLVVSDLLSAAGMPVNDATDVPTGGKRLVAGPRKDEDYTDEAGDPDPNRAEFARCTTRAWNAIAGTMMRETERGEIATSFFPQVVTVSGAPPVAPIGGIGKDVGGDVIVGPTENGPLPSGEWPDAIVKVGAWPVAAYVVIAIAVAGTVYLGQNALEMWNNHLVRSDATENLVKSIAAGVEMQKAHWEAERLKGQKIPLSDAEIAMVQAINKQSETAAKANDIANQPALPKLFPDTRGVLKDAEEGITDIAGYLVLGAVVLGGAYIFLDHQRKSA